MLTPFLCRIRFVLPVWSPLYYAEHVFLYQCGHPYIMQNSLILPVWPPLCYAEQFYSTSMFTPILCRTRPILPVWSPLYYAEHVVFYQYGHPCIMQNTFCSTSMVILHYAEHACPLHSLSKWNSIGKFIKAPSHAQHRAVDCQTCKQHNAIRIIDISAMTLDISNNIRWAALGLSDTENSNSQYFWE